MSSSSEVNRSRSISTACVVLEVVDDVTFKRKSSVSLELLLTIWNAEHRCRRLRAAAATRVCHFTLATCVDHRTVANDYRRWFL